MANPDRRDALEPFAAMLRRLRLECGQPSYVQLRSLSWRLSPASVSDAFNALLLSKARVRARLREGVPDAR